MKRQRTFKGENVLVEMEQKWQMLEKCTPLPRSLVEITKVYLGCDAKGHVVLPPETDLLDILAPDCYQPDEILLLFPRRMERLNWRTRERRTLVTLPPHVIFERFRKPSQSSHIDLLEKTDIDAVNVWRFDFATNHITLLLKSCRSSCLVAPRYDNLYTVYEGSTIWLSRQVGFDVHTSTLFRDHRSYSHRGHVWHIAHISDYQDLVHDTTTVLCVDWNCEKFVTKKMQGQLVAQLSDRQFLFLYNFELTLLTVTESSEFVSEFVNLPRQVASARTVGSGRVFVFFTDNTARLFSCHFSEPPLSPLPVSFWRSPRFDHITDRQNQLYCLRDSGIEILLL